MPKLRCSSLNEIVGKTLACEVKIDPRQNFKVNSSDIFNEESDYLEHSFSA